MNRKSIKHVIEAIILAKVILKMIHKIIYYFSQCIDILTELVVLVVVIIFILGNLRDCLMKVSWHLLQLLQTQSRFCFLGTKTKEFNESCLKQDKITYDCGKVVNIYIVYEISRNINISDYPTLENCLV